MEKSADAFRTISEVAEVLETPAHVLRFWESRFPQIRPVKRAGGRRYYRPADIALLSGIKRLLHDEGMTIRGVQKILREQGVRHVAGLTGADVAEAPFENVEDAEVEQPILAFGKGAAVERRGEVVAFSSATSEPTPPDDSEPPPENAESPAAFVEDPAEAAQGLHEPIPDVTAEVTPAEADPAPAYAASPPEAEPEPVAIEPLEETVAEHPAPEPLASTPPDVLPVDPEAEAQVTGPWLPALLRGLPPGALAARRDAVAPLHARLVELRERLASAHRGGRR